jgi:uncharacterized membrane protein YhaH (DUF805 family)
MSDDAPRSRMTFALAVVRGLQRGATVSGRASWAEYWWFFLFQVTVWAVLYGSVVFVGTQTTNGQGTALGALMLGVSLVLLVMALALLVPGVTVTVRRLHDTDRTGWWALLLVVPLVSIVVFLFCLLPGTLGGNRYGPQSS